MTDTLDKKKKPEPRRPGGKTKRGPNKWLLRIFRGYDASGKRIYFSKTFHGGSREADDRLVELRNNLKAGRPMKFQPKLFKDFFDEWVDERDNGKRRETTIEDYRKFGAILLTPAWRTYQRRHCARRSPEHLRRCRTAEGVHVENLPA